MAYVSTTFSARHSWRADIREDKPGERVIWLRSESPSTTWLSIALDNVEEAKDLVAALSAAIAELE